MGWSFSASLSCLSWFPLIYWAGTTKGMLDNPAGLEVLGAFIIQLIGSVSLLIGLSMLGMGLFGLLRPTTILEVPGSIELPDPVVSFYQRNEPKPAPTFVEQAKDARWLTLYGNPIGMIYFLARTISRWLPMSRCRLAMIS